MNAPTPGSWRLEVDADGIAWLTIDRPGSSANALSGSLFAEFEPLLERFEREPPRALILISGKKSGFVAGADIKEFTGLTDEASGYTLIRRGQQAMDRLEALKCPTVAAIHGFALGGGLELALACRYRVAVGDERLSLGLPEVQLGIHPGFGGTVRTVRLIGVRPAMEMMLTGKPVRAEKARALGLVDRLVAESELRGAAREIALAAPPVRRAPLPERLLSLAPVRPLLKGALIGQVARRAPRAHYPAPYAIIELWTRYGAHGPPAFEAEARSIAHLFTDRDVAQSGARVPPAGSPQGGRRQGRQGARERARGRRRRHGRGHRRLVGAARLQRHAAGPERGARRPRRSSAPGSSSTGA